MQQKEWVEKNTASCMMHRKEKRVSGIADRGAATYI